MLDTKLSSVKMNLWYSDAFSICIPIIMTNTLPYASAGIECVKTILMASRSKNYLQIKNEI